MRAARAGARPPVQGPSAGRACGRGLDGRHAARGAVPCPAARGWLAAAWAWRVSSCSLVLLRLLLRFVLGFVLLLVAARFFPVLVLVPFAAVLSLFVFPCRLLSSLLLVASSWLPLVPGSGSCLVPPVLVRLSLLCSSAGLFCSGCCSVRRSLLLAGCGVLLCSPELRSFLAALPPWEFFADGD